MVEIGSDLWRSFCPIPVFKQEHPEPFSWNHVQMAFEYLHNPHDQSVAVLSHPHNNKVFSDLQTPASVFPFVPIASGSVTEQYWKEPSSIFCTPFLQVFIYIDGIPLWAFLLHAEEFQPPQPFLTGEMFRSLNRFSVSLLSFLQCVHVSLTGELRTRHSPTGIASVPVLSRGKASLPLTCWQNIS